MELLNEVFDEENSKIYPVENVKPKLKVPQVFLIKVPGNNNLMIRLVHGSGQGDAVKNIKMGDKFIQVYVFSVSEKGNIGALKGGLGQDPIGAINTIFETVNKVVKQIKADAVMFRFNPKKMQGQDKAIQRILSRLITTRTGGRFNLMKDMAYYKGKYAYSIMVRKGKKLEEIEGIPEISEELYTKVDSKIGDVYVSKETGENVTKSEALANSIGEKEDKKSELAVMSKMKVSRKELIRAQYGKFVSYVDEDWPENKRERWYEVTTNTPVQTAEGDTVDLQKDIKTGLEKSVPLYVDDIKHHRVRGGYGSNFGDAVERLFLSQMARTHEEWKVFIPSGSDKMKIAEQRIAEVADVIAEAKNPASMETLRKIVEVATRGFDMPEADNFGALRQYQNLVNGVITAYISIVGDAMSTAIEYNREMQSRLDESERDAIQHYCGSGYSFINNYLIGMESLGDPIIDKKIRPLDSAFDKGLRLEPGTLLYRGQRGRYEDFKDNLESKMFYFQNYVSTSLKPIIFGGYSNAGDSLMPNAPSSDLENQETTDDVASSVIGTDNWERVDRGGKVAFNDEFKFGFIIHGADKVKVVIPGILSSFNDEVEVILPRGLAMKVNKVWGTPFRGGTGISNNKTFMVEMTVVPPEQIDESVHLYDGDILMEQGKVEPLEESKFSGFLNEIYFSPDRSMDKVKYTRMMELLAGAINLDGIPEKLA
ncbi:Alt-like ADP-ribosyltransferase [Klebsiella phage Metamorpho]|nr:Alt-like ADP-ribosyltransferase [Klebsiella phage Metamorpho]